MMYLQRLMTLADELQVLSSARFYNLAALETRYFVKTTGRYPSIEVRAEGCEETKTVLENLIYELGYEWGGEGIGLTIVKRGVPAMLTILLPEPSSRVILRASATARRLGIGATGSRILEVSQALLGSKEVAGAVALSILLDTLADKQVAEVIDDLGRIREILSSAAKEVKGL